ncbi:FAD-binding domain-containing protein [Periconia macrospinosa]|uniref:FAD-binding domain-containing protein n=1 Tax=Periconia macrospinosa TaxID=97972 RepID=A0A2V1E8W7_9PLEO|nr:FAD-binding domain-containing protein [Periconia macrospinosa]
MFSKYSSLLSLFVLPVLSSDIVAELGSRLSPAAFITTNISSAPRWSEYHAPQAGYIVHVAEESDVAETVKYCNQNNRTFLAQSGGHGWANTFSMNGKEVIINMRGLNSVQLSDNKTSVRIGGGVINEEIIQVAYENGVQVLNGGCNCVGVLGATLGGGVSRFMNLYGLPADNLISASVVTSTGSVVTASSIENSDLLWALRGAGANFGIVTSAVMNAYPAANNGTVWAGSLIFTGDKLEGFIAAMGALNLTEDMTVHWGFSHALPNNGPAITAEIFFMRGDVKAAREAYQSLYALDPVSDTTRVLQYNHLNDDTIELCEDGGRKPAWHVGLKKLDYPTFQQIWDRWVEFVARTGIDTTILVETYSGYVTQSITSEHASYAHRDINFYAWSLSFWDDESLDGVVEEYGEEVRSLWRSSSGFEQSRAYLNFAHGDEPLEEIYGESLPRLKELKKKWDPEAKFNQFFPIV